MTQISRQSLESRVRFLHLCSSVSSVDIFDSPKEEKPAATDDADFTDYKAKPRKQGSVFTSVFICVICGQFRFSEGGKTGGHG